ncbi:hypothetical protein Anas_11527, partial [Armadillidium nasatum]
LFVKIKIDLVFLNPGNLTKYFLILLVILAVFCEFGSTEISSNDRRRRRERRIRNRNNRRQRDRITRRISRSQTFRRNRAPAPVISGNEKEKKRNLK